MNASAPCTIYLVRHGETDWNIAGRWQGHSNVPLNDEGRRQAERLACRLAEQATRFDALYSSDLSRAWETAEILGRAIDRSPVPAQALREIDLGAWSGKTHAEIARDYPDEWARARVGEDIPRGGGETFAALQARVAAWLDRAADHHAGGTICAVTHGGCIRSILLTARGLAWSERDKIAPLPNTSIAIVERVAGRWSIARINGEDGVRGADEPA
jgi:broad specificity phosphatase PhoE